jgi:DNA-binding LytR/AlgR family response regulator
MWQPIFEGKNERLRWLLCLAIGVYLNIFIFLFEPYRGDIFTYSVPIYYQFVFGGIVTVVFILTGIVFPRFFPRLFSPPFMTLSRFFIWLFGSLFMCHILSFLYDNWLINHENSFSWFLNYEIHYAIPTVVITAFPFLTFVYFYIQKNNKLNEKTNELTTENKAESPILIALLNDELKENTPPQYLKGDGIKLIDFSEKNTFETTKNKLVYITSADNYIEVFYLSEAAILSRVILRQTLKEVENQLIMHAPTFFRCHKAFIVNQDKIIAIHGNSKSYQLTLEGGNKPIPVSRQKNEELLKTFAHLLNS